MGLPESVSLVMWSGLARIKESNLATVAFLLALQFWNPCLTFTDKHLTNYISEGQTRGGTRTHVQQAVTLALKVSGFEIQEDSDLPNLKPASLMSSENATLDTVLQQVMAITRQLDREPPLRPKVPKALHGSLVEALETGCPQALEKA